MPRGGPSTPRSHSEGTLLFRSPLLDTACVFVRPASCNRRSAQPLNAAMIRRPQPKACASALASVHGQGGASLPQAYALGPVIICNGRARQWRSWEIAFSGTAMGWSSICVWPRGRVQSIAHGCGCRASGVVRSMCGAGQCSVPASGRTRRLRLDRGDPLLRSTAHAVYVQPLASARPGRRRRAPFGRFISAWAQDVGGSDRLEPTGEPERRAGPRAGPPQRCSLARRGRWLKSGTRATVTDSIDPGVRAKDVPPVERGCITSARASDPAHHGSPGRGARFARRH